MPLTPWQNSCHPEAYTKPSRKGAGKQEAPQQYGGASAVHGQSRGQGAGQHQAEGRSAAGGDKHFDTGAEPVAL